MKYQPPFGSVDPDAAYINGDAALGLRGSRPPAAAIEDPQRELQFLIESAGLTPDENDMTQVATAVALTSRIIETVDLFVPAQYPTVNAALEYLGTKMIDLNRTVRIILAAGDHYINLTSGPWVFNHPFGQRIEIVGQDMLGAFPNASSVQSSTPGNNESVLRSLFPTRVVCTGSHGIIGLAGYIGRIRNLLFIGDGSNIWNGFFLGQWQGRDGQVGLRLENVWCHNFGGDGFQVFTGSRISGQNLGATNNLGYGFRAGKGGRIYVDSGLWISQRNGISGILALDQSEVGNLNSDVYSNYNGGTGIAILPGAVGNFYGTALVQARSNSQYGVYCQQAEVSIKNADVNSNASGDFFASIDASIWRVNTPAGSPSYSPAAGTVGNNNSIIV